MGIVRAFLNRRSYRKSFQHTLNIAISSVVTSEKIINNILLSDKDSAFVNYSLMLDMGDEAIKTCKHYINAMNNGKEWNSEIRSDLTDLAKIYEILYRKFIFVGLALSSIGGFQPLRAKEMLEVEIKYPTNNKEEET